MRADLENGPESWEPEGGWDTDTADVETDSNGVPVSYWEAMYALPTGPTNAATH